MSLKIVDNFAGIFLIQKIKFDVFLYNIKCIGINLYLGFAEKKHEKGGNDHEKHR